VRWLQLWAALFSRSSLPACTLQSSRLSRVREAHTALQNAFVYAEGDIDRQELQLAALHSDMLDLADKEQTIHREIESTAKESDIAYNAVQLALQQRKLDDAAMLQARVVAAYPSRSESHREILSLCEEIAQLEQEGAKSAAMIERLRQLAAPALELLFLYSQTVLNASRNESVDDASKD